MKNDQLINHPPEDASPPANPPAGVDNLRSGESAEAAGLPSPLPEGSAALSAHLERLAGRARDYVDAASSDNTRRACASDWKHFSGSCRRRGIAWLTPSPKVVGLYITACASGAAMPGGRPSSVSTIERRLSAIAWHYTWRGTPLDRKDRHIATVLPGICCDPGWISQNLTGQTRILRA
jgi:hypothetical protein